LINNWFLFKKASKVSLNPEMHPVLNNSSSKVFRVAMGIASINTNDKE
jgi:hypothetical protein